MDQIDLTRSYIKTGLFISALSISIHLVLLGKLTKTDQKVLLYLTKTTLQICVTGGLHLFSRINRFDISIQTACKWIASGLLCSLFFPILTLQASALKVRESESNPLLQILKYYD